MVTALGKLLTVGNSFEAFLSDLQKSHSLEHELFKPLFL
jgi:hypothetical protein